MAGILASAVPNTADHQRARLSRITQAEVEGCEAAHGQADHVCVIDSGCVDHRGDVVGGVNVGIVADFGRYIGRGKSARIVGQAAITASEVTNLRFPTPDIAAKLMNEDDCGAAARILIIETDAIGFRVRHDSLPMKLPIQFTLAMAERDGKGLRCAIGHSVLRSAPHGSNGGWRMRSCACLSSIRTFPKA